MRLGRSAVRGWLVALVVVVALPGSVVVAPAASAHTIGEYETVRFVPGRDSTIEFQGRRYRGVIEVRRDAEGLVVVEHTDVDGYLEGIAEVPFSWPRQALAAQAVAARTYLAYTLSGGRRGAGADHGFDICASSACQVYAGVGLVEGARGDRWAEAVHGTADQILVYEGRPAETYYHSTSGGRTEAVQDVWSGATPLPYLQGAESPGERSPFVAWRVTVPADVFLAVLDRAGLGVGDTLLSVDVVPSAQGDGVWQARILGNEGLQVVDVSRIRGAMNRYGDELFPDLLPGVRSNGSRYPQPILSYRFEMGVEAPLERVQRSGAHRYLPGGDLPPPAVVVFDGNGWGHHIGMSQYGARALADAGMSYDEILAHFYGGLEPVVDPDVLPDRVAVGLAWGRSAIELSLDGPVVIEGDGVTVVEDAVGPWSIVNRGGAVVLRSDAIEVDPHRRRFFVI